VVVQTEAGAEGEGAGARELLHEDRVVAEVRLAAAAVPGGHGRAEKPRLTGLFPQFTVDQARGLPAFVLGDDVASDELPYGVPEVVVDGVEEGAFHRQLQRGRGWSSGPSSVAASALLFSLIQRSSCGP